MALIHLDAGILIGFLDTNDAHHGAARLVLSEAIDRADRLAVAASAFAECLVGPARRSDAAIAIVSDLCSRLPIEVVPLDVATATTAARLRARHTTLRLPDALVIATACEAGADRLVTTDRGWPRAADLAVSLTIQIVEQRGA